MPIVLNSNIAALRAAGWLTRHTAELGDVYERLSSGQRINHASDDAAGLSLATKLNSDRRVYTQGMRNINDGISLVNIAESAINEMQSIVLRIQELAEQAANGTATSSQRLVLDEEAQTLAAEYARILESTEFNSMEMFDGTFDNLKIQAGYGTQGEIPIAIDELENGLGSSVPVYETVGDGTFDAGVGYAVTGPGGSSGMVLEDINEDGVLDIVTARSASWAQRGLIDIRLGVGDGTFGASTTYETLEYAGSHALSVGDLNGDGHLDIVTAGDRLAGYGGGGGLTVRLGNGNGTFGAATGYTTLENELTMSVRLGDVNGDNKLDIVTAGYYGPSGTMGGSTVRLGNGNGTFGAATGFDTADEDSYTMELVDINDDNVLDLVTGGDDGANNSTITIRLGNGNGTFGAIISYYTTLKSNTEDIAVGDIDGDGVLDLVVAADTGAPSGLGAFSVMLGNGNGTFATGVSYYSGHDYSTQSLQLYDVDGDDVLDLISVGGTWDGQGTLAVSIGNGDGTFGSPTTYLTTETKFEEAVAIGDLNNDGALDIVTGGVLLSDARQTTVFLGNTQTVLSSGADFNLRTQSSALSTLTITEDVLTELASRRGTLGAYQSRLQHAFNHLSSTTINLADAESRIMDADIANDVAQLLRLQVLQQATTAVLGQANTQPALALKLLKR